MRKGSLANDEVKHEKVAQVLIDEAITHLLSGAADVRPGLACMTNLNY